MSFARLYSAQMQLLKGQLVTVEVDISRGLNAFSIVGLPDKAVEEARDRVGGALKNSGFPSPKHTNVKTIVSLAPAELKKEGAYFDVAIALGFLLASDEIRFDPEGKIFIGELSLNGDIQNVRGIIPIVQAMQKKGIREMYVPWGNRREAALVPGITIYGVKTFRNLVDHLDEKIRVEKPTQLFEQPQTEVIYTNTFSSGIDFSDVRGQETAKRGLEIAAAGGHNIAMYGPPGTGKTMLARVFATLLPQMDLPDVLEVTGIHSAVGVNENDIVTEVPFRSPHHTASYVSMVGGGANLRPGEVTLAHKGVLFLDEFPEFDKKVIEALRQPLEDNVVSVSRARGTANFPSNFILVAAMNPCPCGNLGNKQKRCICKPNDIARYQRKISGPIIDRIDIWVQVADIDYKKLAGVGTGEKTEVIKKRVQSARNKQKQRFTNHKKNITTNAEMNVKDLAVHAQLAPKVRDLLDQSAEKLQLSPRAYHRVIKLARTIADLANANEIETTHILEALQYRPQLEQY